MTRLEKRVAYSLWLSEVLGPCNSKFLKLLERFGSIEELYDLRETSEAALFLSPAEYQRARTTRLSDLDTIFEYCDKAGTKIVCYGDEAYPKRLRETHIPPVLLYVDGDVNVLDTVAIAGVGSRYSTQYGRDAVRFLCEPLSAAGITLVSGLAAGTDTEVHKAALKMNGKTVAVLGTGIDTTYPKHHLEIRSAIEQNGAVVSEYPPMAKNSPYMFPLRNRIISGLSKAVVIFEAAKRSGTMITANWALDDGREVFAVPGSILSERSEGTNRLLKQGATPALSAADILETLGLEQKTKETPLEATKRPKLSGVGKSICDILMDGEQSLDSLVERTNRSSSELLSSLTMLELDGIVGAVPGQRYRLII